MVEVFTLNSSGKIELTKKELKELLDKAYWEGYYKNCYTNWWTYTSPTWIQCQSSNCATSNLTITPDMTKNTFTYSTSTQADGSTNATI